MNMSSSVRSTCKASDIYLGCFCDYSAQRPSLLATTSMFSNSIIIDVYIGLIYPQHGFPATSTRIFAFIFREIFKASVVIAEPREWRHPGRREPACFFFSSACIVLAVEGSTPEYNSQLLSIAYPWNLNASALGERGMSGATHMRYTAYCLWPCLCLCYHEM